MRKEKYFDGMIFLTERDRLTLLYIVRVNQWDFVELTRAICKTTKSHISVTTVSGFLHGKSKPNLGNQAKIKNFIDEYAPSYDPSADAETTVVDGQ